MASRRALVPVLPLFAAFFVHSLLPSGAFGAHDVAMRALVTAATAAVVAMLILRKRASTS